MGLGIHFLKERQSYKCELKALRCIKIPRIEPIFYWTYHLYMQPT